MKNFILFIFLSFTQLTSSASQFMEPGFALLINNSNFLHLKNQRENPALPSSLSVSPEEAGKANDIAPTAKTLTEGVVAKSSKILAESDIGKLKNALERGGWKVAVLQDVSANEIAFAVDQLASSVESDLEINKKKRVTFFYYSGYSSASSDLMKRKGILLHGIDSNFEVDPKKNMNGINIMSVLTRLSASGLILAYVEANDQNTFLLQEKSNALDAPVELSGANEFLIQSTISSGEKGFENQTKIDLSSFSLATAIASLVTGKDIGINELTEGVRDYVTKASRGKLIPLIDSGASESSKQIIFEKNRLMISKDPALSRAIEAQAIVVAEKAAMAASAAAEAKKKNEFNLHMKILVAASICAAIFGALLERDIAKKTSKKMGGILMVGGLILPSVIYFTGIYIITAVIYGVILLVAGFVGAILGPFIFWAFIISRL